MKCDDIPLDQSPANSGMNKKENKKTGARNDRVVNFKVDNRSFCMGDPHILYGMISDMKIKVEESMITQMDHFYYDGNIASCSKSSKLDITKKKAGYKIREDKKDNQ